jgi:uncharacterized membrane protein
VNEERFSASDLEPSDDEKRALVRANIDRVAAAVAVLAAGVWVGGMVALGACAAPAVFQLTPAPHSGNAMGVAFARFDKIALGAAVLVLAAEVARTWAAGGRARLVAARVRRLTAFAAAACAAYIGLALTPQINELHLSGAQRGVGPAGEVLEAVHKRAELVGKVETGLGVALVALHVFTLALRRPEEDDDHGYAEPLPPGPRET